MQDIPPFMYNAIRQFLAGLILIGIGFSKSDWSFPNIGELKQQIFPGILMITIGQGFVGWALLYIPSGLTALIISILPVYVIVIEMIIARKFHLGKLTVIGVLLGVFGMVIVFRENFEDLFNPKYQIGLILALIAGFCWAGASIYIQRNPVKLNSYWRIGTQLFVGSLGLLVFTIVFGEFDQFNGFTPISIFSLSYMIVLGSIIGFMVYFYSLTKLPMIQVSVVTYINPIVAAVVAWWFFQEEITIHLLIAFILIMAGVFLINRGQKSS